ncbi:hypothetical protein STCU_10019 [Strigomonas culicis]|uniref:Uncharacterized protein n=1 Tax=Strigomonas culicis TaxID=28005 RepID=S9TNS1_9TRYP|nr:hypothetical protein STCU_10019 [Strigomonas culicis]|eukprot:EPY18359.1 hypothetical protein STCU_10019 [Strigomonas culicis]
MRYLSPQPAMTGPPVPQVPKLDPRRLFGGDCLAEAQWVCSPRDVDLDGDVPRAPTPEELPPALTAPEVPRVPSVPVRRPIQTAPDSETATQTKEKEKSADDFTNLLT